MNRYCLYHPAAGDSSHKEIPSNGDSSSQKPGEREKKITHFIFKETALTQENMCAT